MRLTNLLKLLRYNYKPLVARHYSDAPKALRSLKAKSTRDTVQFYVDSCRVRVVAGNGGDGCISFLSAWCKEHAGPDGGDGGNGGHVIFQASPSVRSLNHVRAVIPAAHGECGDNKDRTGKNAKHVIVPVPLGTIVKDPSGRALCDLSAPGALFVAARGGARGRGNRFFLTDTEQAPSIAELGAIGETLQYHLEVRSMAHVGLLGCPNAGKSTLLRAVTRARPKVAPHAFTTLRPHIGMIPYSDHEQIAVADLPGLIAGSHRNRGLGIQFLQHIQRCLALVYLLDGSNSPLDQLQTLAAELGQYDPRLLERPSLVVVNKVDLEEGRRGWEEVRSALGGLGGRGLGDGTVGGQGRFDSSLEGQGSYDSSLGDEERLDSSLKGQESYDSSLGSQELNSSLKGIKGCEEDKERFDSSLEGNKVCNSTLGDKERFDSSLGNQESCGSTLGDNERFDSNLEGNENDSFEGEIGMEAKNFAELLKVKEIVGVSAKTGVNIEEFLRLLRVMYDTGAKNETV